MWMKVFIDISELSIIKLGNIVFFLQISNSFLQDSGLCNNNIAHKSYKLNLWHFRVFFFLLQSSIVLWLYGKEHSGLLKACFCVSQKKIQFQLSDLVPLSLEFMRGLGHLRVH